MQRTLLPLAFLLVLSAPAWSLEAIPEPVGLVNDGAQVLKRPQDLEARLYQLEKDTGVEMTVVTRAALPKAESLESYSTRLFNQWGIGKKQDQNGLLFFLAFKERKMRLEVGSGLKNRLSDTQAQAILDQQVKPKFKTQDFDGGLAAALDQIEKKFKQKSLQDLEAGVATYAETDDKAWIWGLGLLGAVALFFLFIGYWFLRFVLGFFRSFAKAISDAPGKKSAHLTQARSADTELSSTPSLLPTHSNDDDSWRSSFSSGSDSSSSFDSFGGGSSDGGGASSDW